MWGAHALPPASAAPSAACCPAPPHCHTTTLFLGQSTVDMVVQHGLWAEPASSTHLLGCCAESLDVCTSTCMLTPPSTPTPAPHVSRTAGPMASVGTCIK